jgi:hypothetical protein|tara:strand:+ start:2305 stop:2844 length:540 start_codon:yes stop_codon:yes gene_type:complete
MEESLDDEPRTLSEEELIRLVRLNTPPNYNKIVRRTIERDDQWVKVVDFPSWVVTWEIFNFNFDENNGETLIWSYQDVKQINEQAGAGANLDANYIRFGERLSRDTRPTALYAKRLNAAGDDGESFIICEMWGYVFRAGSTSQHVFQEAEIEDADFMRTEQNRQREMLEKIKKQENGSG